MKRQCKKFDSFPVQRERWGMLAACTECGDRKICLGEAPEPDEPPKKKPGRKPGTVLTVQQRKNLSDGLKKAAAKRKATPLNPPAEPEAETAAPTPMPTTAPEPTSTTEQELIPAVEPAQVAKRVERARHARASGKRMQEARAENRYEVDFNADPELLARLFQIADYERRTPQDQLKIMIRDFPLPEARI